LRFLAAILISVLLALPALSVELYRYRGAAKDGGTLEYVFESDESQLPKTVTKEKVAEIAADFMTTFYGIQVGALVYCLLNSFNNLGDWWPLPMLCVFC
jgi:hypothetical protein